MTAERILSAIRARGCESIGAGDEFRHAVHEAVHGLRLGVPRWTNDKIHRACMKVRRGDRLKEELVARAVEQLVCARVGVACDTVEHFALWTCMESMKNGLDIGKVADVAEGVRRYMADVREVAPLVEQILTLDGAAR